MKRERFVDEYLLDLDCQRAYAAAGYSPDKQNAHRMLQSTDVQELIRARMQARAEKMQVDQQRVIEGLLGELRKSDAKAADRIRVWHLLGQHLGMFTEREVAAPTSPTVVAHNFVVMLPEKAKDAEAWSQRFKTPK